MSNMADKSLTLKILDSISSGDILSEKKIIEGLKSFSGRGTVLSIILINLEGKGCIERVADPKNKSKKFFYSFKITAKGQFYLENELIPKKSENSEIPALYTLRYTELS